MNWEALGAIGELVGAIVVVGTLIYLTIQLKENNKNLKVHTFNETFRGREEMTRELQSQVGIGGIFVKIISDLELSDSEQQAATTTDDVQ
ncbi:MAG: hypothetical protein ACI9CE_000107 [Flavobacterium sp.]|jgi:hypothetical protein